jgi:hypothetical protein
MAGKFKNRILSSDSRFAKLVEASGLLHSDRWVLLKAIRYDFWGFEGQVLTAIDGGF